MECLRENYLAIQMATLCTYPMPATAQCMTDHFAGYGDDPRAFSDRSREVIAWKYDYGAERGFDPASKDSLCAGAIREIEDGTAVGNLLKAAQ